MAGDGGMNPVGEGCKGRRKIPPSPDLLCDFADWMKLQWGYGM